MLQAASEWEIKKTAGNSLEDALHEVLSEAKHNMMIIERSE
jgi:hypothetical protein